MTVPQGCRRFRLTVCALTFYFSLRTVKLPIFDLFEQDSATVRLPRASGQEEAHVVVSPRGCRWVHCDALHLVLRKHVYLHVIGPLTLPCRSACACCLSAKVCCGGFDSWVFCSWCVRVCACVCGLFLVRAV